MKMRTFEFTDDAEGRTDYRLTYEAFRLLDASKCTSEERPHMAATQRVLEGAGDPVGELNDEIAEESTVDMRMRKLKEGGAKVTVSQKVHEKIEGWVSNTKFQSGFSIAVEDFLARWGMAEKTETADDAAVELPGAARKRTGLKERAH